MFPYSKCDWLHAWTAAADTRLHRVRIKEESVEVALLPGFPC